MTLQKPGLTTLAKQGDVTAIAALINRTLQPKGIVARVTQQQGHLRVLLEGQTVPDQTILAPFVRKGVLALQIPGFHTLSVWGRSKGTSTPAWSETFALSVADTELSATPQAQPEKGHSEIKPTVERSGNGSGSQAEDPLRVIPETNAIVEQSVASIANPDAIAAHLNQAMGTEALVFEATLSDRSLKLTAKTNQILEGDTFAKAVQALLLALNLADLDTVQLFKQKTTGKNPYKIKEFTLYREPVPTEVKTSDAVPPQATHRATAHAQPTPAKPLKPAPPASNQPRMVAIALAALFVVLLIGAIKFLAKPPAAKEICQDAVGKAGYCQLAVQMVGEQTLHNLKAAATPLTSELEEHGLGICANAFDRQLQRNLDRQKNRYSPSINAEPIFPGIMLVDTQLKASPQAETPLFRTACLYAGNEHRVELIKNVVLPNDWPEEPYQGKQEGETTQRSLKVHQIIIMLGGGTLFTAIGLFAACTLNLGVQIYTIRGLFQTASILGTLDTLLIVLSGGKSNLFGGVPLTCLALGLTQVWVKDLRVDWAAGYRTVALGVFVMMVIRFVLNWLLLGFIFSVL